MRHNRKAALTLLRPRPRADKMLRRLVEGDPQPLLILLTDRRILLANPPAARCLRVGLTQLCRAPLALFLAEIDSYSIFDAALAAPSGQHDLVMRRQDGELFPARLVWTFLQTEGSIALWIEDLDQAAAAGGHWQRLQQETERSAAAKTLFLATMSHEIRTPMNGMIGMLELLGQSALSADQREMVEIVQESGRTLLSITDQILDLSKIEAGKLTLDCAPFCLRAIVEEMVELLATKARGKMLELAWWCDPALPDHYYGDQVRLKQIGLNLLSNAVKFTDHGSVILRLHGLGRKDDRPLVRFEITDTGIGLSPAQQQQLFQPFAQADHTPSRDLGGTGLGLSICHRLAALMGGEIGLVSAPDAGSTFWVEIPLTPDDRPHPEGDALRGITALVVDDLPESRATLAAQLRGEGAIVLEASDPLAAEERLQEAPALEVAVVDLPGDLTTLLPALLARLPPSAILATLPVADETATAWCGLQGLAPPLVKPLRKKQLLRAVAIALGRPPAVEAALPAAALPRLGGAAAILVAEDNAINRRVVGKQLRQLGFSCDIADHGEAAWAMLQNKSYQLLLTDCIMPVLDGYDLARRIRGREARQGGHLPIVALTANVLEGEAEKCRRAGMDDYVSKPLTLERLATLLRKVFPDLPAATPVATAAAAAFPLDDDPPIDWRALGAILGSTDHADLRDVAGFLVTNLAGLLDDLRRALAVRDATAALRAAHSAKGAAQNGAAAMVAERMAALETALRGNTDPAVVPQMLAAAEHEFARLRDYLGAGRT
jgi:signal transduction histidine kinase/CheY-like chemotaxis protein